MPCCAYAAQNAQMLHKMLGTRASEETSMFQLCLTFMRMFMTTESYSSWFMKPVRGEKPLQGEEAAAAGEQVSTGRWAHSR